MTRLFALAFRRAAIALAAYAALVAGCPAASATTADAVDITGEVRNPTTLTVDVLHALPRQTQSVTFESSKGPQSHTYGGANLIDIVTAAEPIVDSPAAHSLLSVVIVATGADGYTAAVAWGEISPDFAATPVLVAYTEDGIDLNQPRLVVPGDIKGGRYVSDLTELRIVDFAGR